MQCATLARLAGSFSGKAMQYMYPYLYTTFSAPLRLCCMRTNVGGLKLSQQADLHVWLEEVKGCVRA